MSKWDQPIKIETLFFLIFYLAVFCMVAVPIAFVFAFIAGALGFGGTQDMATILVSFGITAVLGITGLFVLASKL